jgi:serine/threonine protein kinase
MRKLNTLAEQLTANEVKKGNPFIPELIDIICPESKRPSQIMAKGLDLSQICLVMEFFDTDLDQLLKHKIDFSEHHLIKIVYNSLCSMAFLHLSNLIHRDVKPANILISSDCNVKLCDFGLSRSLPMKCNFPKDFDTSKLTGEFDNNLNSVKVRIKATERFEQKRSQTLQANSIW